MRSTRAHVRGPGCLVVQIAKIRAGEGRDEQERRDPKPQGQDGERCRHADDMSIRHGAAPTSNVEADRQNGSHGPEIIERGPEIGDEAFEGSRPTYCDAARDRVLKEVQHGGRRRTLRCRTALPSPSIQDAATAAAGRRGSIIAPKEDGFESRLAGRT